MDVHLKVYDISMGMARQMSLPLLGTHLDYIPHTGVVYGGNEVRSRPLAVV